MNFVCFVIRGCLSPSGYLDLNRLIEVESENRSAKLQKCHLHDE